MKTHVQYFTFTLLQSPCRHSRIHEWVVKKGKTVTRWRWVSFLVVKHRLAGGNLFPGQSKLILELEREHGWSIFCRSKWNTRFSQKVLTGKGRAKQNWSLWSQDVCMCVFLPHVYYNEEGVSWKKRIVFYHVIKQSQAGSFTLQLQLSDLIVPLGGNKFFPTLELHIFPVLPPLPHILACFFLASSLPKI